MGFEEWASRNALRGMRFREAALSNEEKSGESCHNPQKHMEF
jgi:hypothetical protein